MHKVYKISKLRHCHDEMQVSSPIKFRSRLGAIEFLAHTAQTAMERGERIETIVTDHSQTLVVYPPRCSDLPEPLYNTCYILEIDHD